MEEQSLDTLFECELRGIFTACLLMFALVSGETAGRWMLSTVVIRGTITLINLLCKGNNLRAHQGHSPGLSLVKLPLSQCGELARFHPFLLFLLPILKAKKLRALWLCRHAVGEVSIGVRAMPLTILSSPKDLVPSAEQPWWVLVVFYCSPETPSP